MFRHIASAVALAILVAGCGSFAPSPNKPDQLILYAGDAGLGCAAIPLLAPNTVLKAKSAVGCAKALLASDPVDLTKVVQCAQANGVPNEYASIVGLVLARIQARMGDSVFPVGSVGGEAVKAFLYTCDVALGPTVLK